MKLYIRNTAEASNSKSPCLRKLATLHHYERRYLQQTRIRKSVEKDMQRTGRMSCKMAFCIRKTRISYCTPRLIAKDLGVSIEWLRTIAS
jgi:hypothetical protein